jgi:MSHA biogenesis protein MshJ
MKGLWVRYSARIDAMTPRERAMVFAAGACALVFVLWGLAIQPLWDRNHRLAAQSASQGATVVALEAQKRELQAQLATSPDAETNRRIAELDRRLANLDATLTQMQSGLIAPARMPALIKGIVGRAPRLQLVAMRTLPVTPLLDKAAGSAASETSKTGSERKTASDPGIFKHGIEITLEGRYLDLLEYAAQLEAMPTRVMWNRTRIDALDYPRVTMTLTLYTLSLERTWLTI